MIYYLTQEKKTDLLKEYETNLEKEVKGVSKRIRELENELGLDSYLL